MLLLSRRLGEQIVIGDHLRVTVLKIRGNRVRLGVTAPAGFRIRREEIPDKACGPSAAGCAEGEDHGQDPC
jgi:carbon storage regulator